MQGASCEDNCSLVLRLYRNRLQHLRSNSILENNLVLKYGRRRIRARVRERLLILSDVSHKLLFRHCLYNNFKFDFSCTVLLLKLNVIL